MLLIIKKIIESPLPDHMVYSHRLNIPQQPLHAYTSLCSLFESTLDSLPYIYSRLPLDLHYFYPVAVTDGQFLFCSVLAFLLVPPISDRLFKMPSPAFSPGRSLHCVTSLQAAVMILLTFPASLHYLSRCCLPCLSDTAHHSPSFRLTVSGLVACGTADHRVW